MSPRWPPPPPRFSRMPSELNYRRYVSIRAPNHQPSPAQPIYPTHPTRPITSHRLLWLHMILKAVAWSVELFSFGIWRLARCGGMGWGCNRQAVPSG